MTREIVGAILVGLVLLGAAAIALNQRRKRKIQESIIAEPKSSPVTTFDFTGSVQYVATVFSGEPLRKVTAHGLGPRGHGRVYSAASGVLIERTGERDFFIPIANISEFGFTNATIDRAVEKDGLVSLHWSLGEMSVITQLRFRNVTERDEMIASIAL